MFTNGASICVAMLDGSDSASASKGLELAICNYIVLKQLNLHLHHISNISSGFQAISNILVIHVIHNCIVIVLSAPSFLRLRDKSLEAMQTILVFYSVIYIFLGEILLKILLFRIALLEAQS